MLGVCVVVAVVCMLAGFQHVSAEYITMQSYYNSENATYNFYQNIEHHCFSSDYEGGEPNYVRGIYGRRGYFEGYMSNMVANVNFYEITLDGTDLVPSSGSAQLTYSEDYSAVTGTFWNSGESNIYNSRGDWGITGTCDECAEDTDDYYDDDGSTNQDILAKHCFYKPSYKSDAEALETLSRGRTNNLVFGAEPGYYNVFNRAGLGSIDTAGHMVGGYQYIYSDDACASEDLDCVTHGRVEHGHYGLNAVSPNLRSIQLMASTWTAVTGPMTGSSGPALYGIVYDTQAEAFKYIGYFCNSKVVDGEVVLTGCVHQHDVAVDDFVSEAISKEVEQPYRELAKEGGMFQRLKVFGDAVFPSQGFLRSLLSL